ncbi:MAG TPA: response regulator [Burkholderiales bacterium]|nr:response regulator [Burkholderiales bacterium]
MTGPRTSILHVEDDPSLQNLVRITLEQLGGYAVRTAANGYQALDLARQALPDLLLLDLDLPGMNGIATLRALREIDGMGEVPVVFLTAASDLMGDAEFRAFGVREVLPKPFRPRQLVQALARVLGPRGD